MSVREVPQGEWASTLEAFGREHRAWLATVEHVASDGTRDMLLPDRPLAGVFTEGERTGLAVRIELTPDSVAGTSSLRIEDPVAVRVDLGRGGPASTLEIEDRDGGRTCVRFRANPALEMLDGVAPGEV
jgi:hypothetical protein